MSRHRNVRSMNYSEEYDGYDDVYGHSVEDDYCMSPSEAAFLYDREGSKSKQKIGAFFQTVNEETELESKESSLSEIDRARLESCIEQMRQTIGPAVPRQDLINVILLYNFNIEKAINFILGSPQYQAVIPQDKKEKDVNSFYVKSSKGFAIPKLNGANFKSPLNTSPTNTNFSSLNELVSNHLQKVNEEQKILSFPQNEQNSTKNSSNFNTLADLTSNHLNNINFNMKPGPKIDMFSMNLLKNNKSTSLVENQNLKDSINNSWHIDLTKALRVANSAPQLQTRKDKHEQKAENTENFIPAFIDCETELENSEPSQFCNMDISWVLSIKVENSKRRSKFGKVLCRRYKRPRPYFVNDEYFYNSSSREISPFLFNTPSPDDLISRHLAQK